MDRFHSISNTSPIQSALKNEDINWPRARHDLSRTWYGQALIGACHPIDLIRTLPNSDYDIDISTMVKLRNPLRAPLLSGMRMYTHVVYCRDKDLWEGGKSKITHGRRGDIVKHTPYLEHLNPNNNVDTLSVFSPACSLGINPTRFYKFNPLASFVGCNLGHAIESHVPEHFNALPLVLYQKYYVDVVANKNLLQDNRKILPDVEDHLKLPFDCESAFWLDYDSPSLSSYPTTGIDNPNSTFYIPEGSEQRPLALNALRFRQFKGDYFTTALPFPDLIRGTAPKINITDIAGSINWDNVFIKDNPSSGGISAFNVSAILHTPVSVPIDQAYVMDNSNQDVIKRAFNKAVLNLTANASLSLNDFRYLEAYTIFMERMGQTDGDYDSMIYAQFGYDPHSDNDHVKYVGGMFQDIIFSDVTQTSGNTDDSLLGQKAGQATSVSGGNIGHFFSPDFGYLMTIISIVPDTIYIQGTERLWTMLDQADDYFPILNNLSPQPILNQELYCDGINDIGLFAYQERYGDIKSRQSIATGFHALKSTDYENPSATLMRRFFSSTPTLSNSFVSMSLQNIDYSIFQVANEPPFEVICHSDVKATLPVPYITTQGGLSPRG